MRRLIRELDEAARWLERQLEQDRWRRYLVYGLVLAASGLLIWMMILGSTLTGQAQVRDWSIAWLGLDSAEAAGLALTGLLVYRRHAAACPVAAVTATLFALDAWFDVTTSLAGAEWYEALLFAFASEIPLTVLLAGVSVVALRRWKDNQAHAQAPSPAPAQSAQAD